MGSLVVKFDDIWLTRATGKTFIFPTYLSCFRHGTIVAGELVDCFIFEIETIILAGECRGVIAANSDEDLVLLVMLIQKSIKWTDTNQRNILESERGGLKRDI